MHDLQAVPTAGKRTWVSMTLRDDSEAVLRSLEPVGAALRSIQDACGPPDASLLNCCSPQAVTRAMPEVVAYCRGVARTWSLILGSTVPHAEWSTPVAAPSTQCHTILERSLRSSAQTVLEWHCRGCEGPCIGCQVDDACGAWGAFCLQCYGTSTVECTRRPSSRGEALL